MKSDVQRAILIVGIAALSTISPPANAILIAANYEGEFAKDGNQALRDLGNAAKGTWESLGSVWNRVANYDFTVTIGTADLGADTFALTHSNAQTDSPYAGTGTYLWTEARIDFNSNATWWNKFWWDPTPLDNSEYNMSEYGGLFGDAKAGTAADNMLDAYSIVLHELGHALGFIGASSPAGETLPWTSYKSFDDNLSNAGTTFTYDYLSELKGQKVPMGNEYHLAGATYPYDSMSVFGDGASGPQLDHRVLISSLDINMISDAFHLIPEPSSLTLLALALVGLACSRRDLSLCVPLNQRPG